MQFVNSDRQIRLTVYLHCTTGAVHCDARPLHEERHGLSPRLLDHGAVDLQRPSGPPRTDSACEGHGRREYPFKLSSSGINCLRLGAIRRVKLHLGMFVTRIKCVLFCVNKSRVLLHFGIFMSPIYYIHYSKQLKEHMLGTSYLVYHTCYTLCIMYGSRRLY